MRILPIAIIGLAALAGCTSSTQRSAAPAPQPAAASGSMESAPGDSIDHFAAAYEAQHSMRRY